MRVYALCLNHLCLPRGATTEYDAEIKQLRDSLISFVVLEAVLQRCSYENMF